MHLGKVTILHISLRSIAEYLAKNSLRTFGKNFLQAIRFAHLAKGVTLQGQFCNFRFAQHLQNYFKCSLRSLFTNKFVYTRDACAQIRPLPWFFRLPNFVLLRAFMAGWMPLYLLHHKKEKLSILLQQSVLYSFVTVIVTVIMISAIFIF